MGASPDPNEQRIAEPRLLPALVFLLAFFSFAYAFHENPWDNALNRLDTAFSIVNHGSLNIDPYASNTMDRAVHKGHYYNSEAIGTSLAAVPILYIYKLISGDPSPGPLSPRPLYLITLFVVALPSAVLAALLFSFMRRFAPSPLPRLISVSAFFFGSLAFSYSTVFYSYLPSLLLCFCAFLLIESPSGVNPKRAAAVGFMTSLSVITSYDSVLIAAPLAVYLFLRCSRKTDFLFAVLAGAPPVAALLAYNHACFGGPLSFGLLHLEHQGWASFNDNAAANMLRVKWPSFYKLVLRPGFGALWQTPSLLFGIAGSLIMLRRPKQLPCGILFLSVFALYVLASAALPDSYGGASAGPRYLTSGLFFALAPLAVFLEYGRAFFRPAAISLIVVSFFQAAVVAFTDPHAPDVVGSPFFGYGLPLLRHGFVATNAGTLLGLRGPVSLLPWLIVFIVLILIFLRASNTRFPDSKTILASIPGWIFGAALAVCVFTAGRELSNPNAPEAAMKRATYLANHGMPLAALEECDTAIRSAPRNVTYLLQRAALLFSLGKSVESLADLERALRIRPDDPQSHLNAAGILLREPGRSAKGLAHLRAALKYESKLTPSAAFQAHLSLGNALLRIGNRAEALEHFHRALAIEPSNAALRKFVEYDR